jgi:hypothetical protein
MVNSAWPKRDSLRGTIPSSWGNMTKLAYLNLHQQLGLCAWSDEDTPFDIHLMAMRDNAQWRLNVSANMDWTMTPQDLFYDMALRPAFGQKGPVWSSGGWSPMAAAGSAGADGRRAIQVMVPYNMTRRPFACLQGATETHSFTRLPEEMMMWPVYTEENCLVHSHAALEPGFNPHNFGRCKAATNDECNGCCAPCGGLHYNHALFVDHRDRRNDWTSGTTRAWNESSGSPHAPSIQSLPPFDGAACERMWRRYFANDTLHATWFRNRHHVREAPFMADCVAKATEWQAGVRSVRIMRNATKPLLAYHQDSETLSVGMTSSAGRYTPTGSGAAQAYGAAVVTLLTASATASMPAHLYGTLPPEWGSPDPATGRITFSNVVLM